MTLLKINRLLPIHISIVLPKFEVDIQSQSKVRVRKPKNPIRQAAILKVTSLKINRLLPMATINMHVKCEIEIPKQTWLMLRKPCRLQTDGRTDGQTDGRTRWIQYTPPPTSLGGGINRQIRVFNENLKTLAEGEAYITFVDNWSFLPDGDQVQSSFYRKNDRIHLNTNGKARLVEMLLRALKETVYWNKLENEWQIHVARPAQQ